MRVGCMPLLDSAIFRPSLATHPAAVTFNSRYASRHRLAPLPCFSLRTCAEAIIHLSSHAATAIINESYHSARNLTPGITRAPFNVHERLRGGASGACPC
jgi:hypothetical protein